MKLRKVSIRNFRNLRTVDIRLSDLTVVIGENNAGKSNLLHALRLLLDTQAEHLRLDLSLDDINDAALDAGENAFSITLEIGGLQVHPEVEACFRERIDTDGSETFVTIEGRFEPDEDGIHSWSSQVLTPGQRHNEPIPMSRRMNRAVPLYYLDAIRDAKRDTRATGRGLLSQLLGELDFSDVEDEIQANLQGANTALNYGQDVSQLANGLTKEMTSLLPGGQSQIAVAVVDENIAHLTRNFRLTVRKNPGAPQTDISRHGTGLQNLTLVAMFRHSINSVQIGRPILAVEEPEAHLHPHAQRRLFKDLSVVKAPVILTTHSPEIVKHTHPKNLVLLRSTASDESCSYQLPPTISESDRKGLEQIMRGGRAEVFFARSIIIVEGHSELITLPAFAEVLGCDLDRDGISMLSADGNNYSFILRACGPDQFNIPTIVTYDTDVLSTPSTGQFMRQLRDLDLITAAEFQQHKSHTNCSASDRKILLDRIGWIGAVDCFEEVACECGYLQIIIQTAESVTSPTELSTYLSENRLNRDAKGISEFVKHIDSDRRRPGLKVPVAFAVADAVADIGLVPECYERAIRRAMLLSMGGIKVDEHFEENACAAGFRNLFLAVIEDANLTPQLEQRSTPSIDGIVHFLTKTEAGQQIRDLAKSVVADAVENAGLSQFAEDIRNQQLPSVTDE